jgi:NAD(P)-dependent dehydrogenase (short-subunit alcohol dehydrogenase family)
LPDTQLFGSMREFGAASASARSGSEDKCVLITGAAGGLGRACAEVMLEQGAKVALIDHDASLLSATARELVHFENRVVTRAGDICNEEALAGFVAETLSRFGAIDAVCNVAGILGASSLEEADRERFDRVMHTNCFSHLLLVQKALPALRASKRASIVNVASVGALVALPHMSIYCASKAAVLGLTRAMAAELAPHIRCNAICPGGIDTPMSQKLLAAMSEAERQEVLPKLTGRQLLKRFASPREIANLVAFLVSDNSSFITGAILPIEGGHTAW